MENVKSFLKQTLKKLVKFLIRRLNKKKIIILLISFILFLKRKETQKIKR